MTAGELTTGAPPLAWLTSSWSGQDPYGNCVQAAVLAPAAGICRCDNDPNCPYCHGEGTVWI